MCFYCGTETFDDWEHDAYGQNKSYGQPLTNELGSILDFANYAKEGFWNDVGSISSEWNLSSTGYRAENGQLDYYFGETIVDYNGLNQTYQLFAAESFFYLESVLGIKFQKYDGGDIDIFFTDNYSGANQYEHNDPLGGFKSLSGINVASNWLGAVGSDYTYQTFMHEIGHALGLGHTGNYNDPAVITEAQYLNDGWPMSIMSYWDTYDNDYLANSFGYVRTLMPADFLALDMIYNDYGFGTINAFTGDTIYGFDTNIPLSSSYFLNKMYTDLLAATYYCIADGAGEDTLNFSGFSNDQLIDLRPSIASNTSATTMNIAGKIGNVSLAVGTIIENAIGGSGHDVIYGNAYNNDITSGNGNDEIYALGGTNTINAGEGDDTIYLCNDYSGSSISFSFSGDATYDTIDGGSGMDTFDLSACDGYDTLNSWRDLVTLEGSGSDFSLELLNSNFTFSITNVEKIQGFHSGTVSSDEFVYWLLPNNVASGSADISIIEIIPSVEFDGADQSHGMSVYTSSSGNYFIADATDETGASMVEAGARLTISNDIYDEDGINNFSYQWYKNGSIIRGENSSTYTLQSGDDRDAFTVAVNFTDGRYYSESVISSALTVNYSSQTTIMDSRGRSSWDPKNFDIAALLEDGSGYKLILHDAAKDSYSSLSVTSSGKTGKKASSLSHAELLSLETTIGVDLNGDGVLGDDFGRNFSLTDPILVNSITTGSQRDPQISVLENGDIAVAWQSQELGGSANDVYLKIYSDTAGTTLENDQIIHEYTIDSQYNPHLAGTSDGGLVVVFQSDGLKNVSFPEGGKVTIAAQAYDYNYDEMNSDFTRVDGITELPVNSYNASTQAYPFVVENDDGFGIFWQSDGQDGSGYGVYGKLYNENGEDLLNIDDISISNNTEGHQDFISGVSLGNDKTALVFQTADNRVAVSILNETTGSLENEYLVSADNSSPQWYPGVAALSDGGYVITWAESDRTIDVYCQFFSSEHQEMTEQILVNSHTAGRQHLPTIASNENDEIFIAWTSYDGQDGSGAGVYGQLFNSMGTKLGDEICLTDETSGSQTDIQVDFLDADTVVYVYSQNDDVYFGGVDVM